jgi:hypothetical protein
MKKDKRYTPHKCVIVHEASTQSEALSWLENNGGGIYRNILHNFDCIVKPKTKKNHDLP